MKIDRTRICYRALAMPVTLSFWLSAACWAQHAPGARPQAWGAAPAQAMLSPASPSADAPAGQPVLPSGLLSPSLEGVQQTLSALRVDKWKRGSVRYEAGEEIGQILHDIQTNLPALLREADAAPGTLSKILPVARHIDALYDVLLRVVEAARIAAPEDQAAQAREALTNLEHARVAFDDRIQEQAVTEERQIGDLHDTVQREAARKCPVSAAPVPAPQPGQTTTKRPIRKKPQGNAAPGQDQKQKQATPAGQKQGAPAGQRPQASAPGAKPSGTAAGQRPPASKTPAKAGSAAAGTKTAPPANNGKTPPPANQSNQGNQGSTSK